MNRLLLGVIVAGTLAGAAAIAIWISGPGAECSSAQAPTSTPFWATLVPDPDPTAVAYWKENRGEFVGPPPGWSPVREVEGSPPSGYSSWDEYFSYLRSLRDYPDVAPDSIILSAGGVGGYAELPEVDNASPSRDDCR